MQMITALLVGLLFGCAIYLILQQSWIKIIFGVGLLTHAVNLFILSMSKNPIGKAAPIIDQGQKIAVVDPLPQALILTAIVIGFGVSAYIMTLVYRMIKISEKNQIRDSK